METQNHGLVFENEIVQIITGFTKSEYEKLLPNSYTSSIDIAKDVHSEHDYSIKVSKNGKSVGGGDILRFNEHCKYGFKLVVGCWSQKSKAVKSYYCVYEFDITPNDYIKLWGNLSLEKLKDFVAYVKSIPAGKKAQLENRNLWKEKRQSLYDSYGKGIISIAAKIDSKTQRRVQCSFTIDELVSSGIYYQKFDTKYKDLDLPYEQNSEPRMIKIKSLEHNING